MAERRVPVDWASLVTALLVDCAVQWLPALAVFRLSPPSAWPLSLACFGAALAVNLVLYSRGTSLGAALCGFRLRRRDGGPPGFKAGSILVGLGVLTVAVVAVMVLLAYNSSSPLTADPRSYPLRAERTRRRRFLEAADANWRRWSG